MTVYNTWRFKVVQKNEENWKTKWTVWDDLRTALKLEKKLRTAETEIYRWIMSNGPLGECKFSKCMSRV